MFWEFSLICHSLFCSHSPAAKDSKRLLFSKDLVLEMQKSLKALFSKHCLQAAWFCGSQVLQTNDIK